MKNAGSHVSTEIKGNPFIQTAARKWGGFSTGKHRSKVFFKWDFYETQFVISFQSQQKDCSEKLLYTVYRTRELALINLKSNV